MERFFLYLRIGLGFFPMAALSAFAARGAEPEVRGETPYFWSGVLLDSEQFWSDVRIEDGWRMQRCAPTGQYRLLDPANNRQVLGSREACLAKLSEARRTIAAKPTGDVVLTLHGLLRTREQMQGLCGYLEREGKFTAVNVTYASTRLPLDAHAANLAEVVSGIETDGELHFVCHSLGNIVVRRYLAEANAAAPRWRVDPRIGRMVMLGPPNNGSQLAVTLGGNKLAGMLVGPCCKQLGKEWPTLKDRLALPQLEFGIIAGGLGDGGGFNPLVPGDDDLVVGVAECRLPGAKDFCLTSLHHGQLMHHQEAQKQVLSFLREGSFLPGSVVKTDSGSNPGRTKP